MSYLEVGEDMHKLASHVVDSVSWNPCFFWLFLGGRPFISKFFVGEVISGPIPIADRPQKWPPGSKNDGVFLGKWHLLLITGADFQVALRSFFGGHFFGVIFCCGGRLAWRFLERCWSWNHHTSYLLGPAQILVRSRKINVPLLCDLFPSVVFSRTQVIYLFVGSCVAPCIVEGMTAFWVNWKFLQVLWAGRGYIILLGYRLACKLLLARCKSSRKYHEKSSLSFKSAFT